MCVCKSWFSLITSSDFINAHLSKALSKPTKSHPLLIRSFRTKNPKRESYTLHFNHDTLRTRQTIQSPLKPRDNLYPRIVGSINGLICLSDDLFGYTYRIMLWNPSIRMYMELPRPNVTFNEVGPYSFALGFGFDAGKNDYKVVRVVYVQGNTGDILPPKVEVFALKEKIWRMVNADRLECHLVEPCWTQCFMNDRVHWISYERKTGGVRNSVVLLFDMRDETFKKMKLPESLLDADPMTLCISVTRGVLTVYEHTIDECCNIWMRTEYANVKSWTKMYAIDGLGWAGKVFGVTENGEVVLAKDRGRWVQNYMDLVLYDPKSKQTKDVGIHGYIDAFLVANYTESLVLLNKETCAISYAGAKIEGKKRYWSFFTSTP